ncbi:beta-galactoside alpha-2,6-sialyltransferase [Branchiostoma belcheri]|nr:beta-galactoside alpha-2,6-sialyltransferase [Branchiostoma belcheri]
MEKRILRFLGTVLCVCVTICVYSIMTRSMCITCAPVYKPKPLNATKIWCSLKRNVPFSTITREQASEDEHKTVLPEESLEKLVHFNSCAVVSSSHGLRLHTYGKEIDSHDAVLRFNCAPTHRFEQFVGNRTDIRLINTKIPQIFCKKEFWSENSTMFTHGSIVIRNMNGINVEEHKINAQNDRFHGFANWIKYSKRYPKRSLPFIQRPYFGNDIMAELSRFCKVAGLCTSKMEESPTTGMLGVVMMLHLCDWVRVYEIVPSNKDRTKLMYYFDEKSLLPKQDRHPDSQEGIYLRHSDSQEKVYLRTLSLTPEKDIDETGVVLLKGFSKASCG